MTAPVFPAFNDWSTNHRGFLARRAWQARVELDEARQEAWVGWEYAERTWDPEKGDPDAWISLQVEVRLRRIAEQARFGIELDAEGAPDFAARDEEEIEQWRGEARRLGAEVERLFNLLRIGGCAALGQAIGRCERRARQLIQEIEEAPERLRMRKLRALARRVARGPHASRTVPSAVQLQLDWGM